MSVIDEFQESLRQSVITETQARVNAMKHTRELADEAFSQLPLAGTTRECPKCRFGMLTYRYTECVHVVGDRWQRGSNDPYLAYPSCMLIVRTCPQCGADTFERPADSVADYEEQAA
ncbi:hypothetical protein ACFYY5_29150 [Nocardia elegans]|uniref:Uncharacterized protein n=1 Tax=Nocardia elegans TaxID=300029 RepID=A0ABW6TLB6_9NOCA